MSDIEPPEADDVLEVDSPEQEPVDDVGDEELEADLLALPNTLHVLPTSKDEMNESILSDQESERANRFKYLPRQKEKPRHEQLTVQNNVPYAVESLEEMDNKLDHILRRLIDCVAAKDFEVGFVQWNHRLECWISLKYPMKRHIRAKLAKLYFEIAVLPGLDTRQVDVAAGMAMGLLESRRRIDIGDIQLPWRSIWALLDKELFPKQRKTGVTGVSSTLLSLVEYSQRFFPPHEIPEMLSLFLPRLSASLNSILATQAFITHFLPTSHPQYYLASIFKLWEAFNSTIWDEQWLDFLERLAVIHVDPQQSNPAIIEEIRNECRENGDEVSNMMVEEWAGQGIPSDKEIEDWRGIRKDVGVFTEEQWNFIMTKCLRSMNVPVGGESSDAITAMDLSLADSAANGVALRMKKPTDKIHSFASIIVYSLVEDSAPSGATPFTSRPTTPNVPLTPPLNRNQKTYLAGSKALDSLAKLIQATETYFHPSNYGSWAPILAQFLQHLTWNYLKRQKEEESRDCNTPQQYRLTPNIRREFVLTLRTVALLSMFSRDAVTTSNAQAALRTMSYLEPDLILPAILERAYPALETLLETHRTTAILNTLAMISMPLTTRTLYSPGAKDIVPLLELALPGLDVNDPGKTMATCMFILQSMMGIMVDDLTTPGASQDPTDSDVEMMEEDTIPVISIEGKPQTTAEQDDQAVRNSTAGFPNWVSSFFRQILAIFEALPEPGKNNKSGGKTEENMTQTMLAACNFVCSALSPQMFDLALELVFSHVTTSIRSNSARGVSKLIGCFTRANNKKTLPKFWEICEKGIREEIDGGASSIRTTSSTGGAESDMMLHWWIGLLTGALVHCGDEILAYRNKFKSLIQFMLEHCKSEKGYTSSAKLLGIVLEGLVTTWVLDNRTVDEDVWNSEKWKSGHHKLWGQTYTANQVKPNWHVPSDVEIDYAIELLEEVARPSLEKVTTMLGDSDRGTLVWMNDFCRYCNVLRTVFATITSIIELPRSEDQRGVFASDAGDEVPGFIDALPFVKAGIVLTDPNDVRYQKVLKLRDDTAKFLHLASQTLREPTEADSNNTKSQDSLDCLKMIIHTIRSLMLNYPCDTSSYTAIKKEHAFAVHLSRLTKGQKEFPRFVWARRAALHHASRLRLCSFYRQRTKLDDLLIQDLCNFSLSTYSHIRRSAQKGLDQVTHYFDGTRTIVYPILFDALKKKGHEVTTDYVASIRAEAALEILSSKMIQNMAILDWRFGPAYLEHLLGCQHFERPSVQKWVQSVAHHFVIRLAEPCTLKSFVKSDSLSKASQELQQLVTEPRDEKLVALVEGKVQERIVQKNEAYGKLIPVLLEIAEAKQTHWRYSLMATRFLRALIRRDLPLRSDVCEFISRQMVSDLLNQRTHAMLALSKILHFIKLRTMSEGSAEKLLLQQTSNPLRKTVTLERPLPEGFTNQFIDGFTKNFGDETLLVDKQSTGWLVWGDTVDFYKVPPEQAEDSVHWDPSSNEAIDSINSIINTDEWWDVFIGLLAQEKTNDYLAADSITVIKSIFQIFRTTPCQYVLHRVDELIADKADRHKQRAAAELIGGMVRGSKHWAMKQQAVIWDWLTPKLPGILKGITVESQLAWEMCVEYILTLRDPRRNQPLVDYITSLTIDPDSSEAFNTAKQMDLVGTTMKALGWHFVPWADKYTTMFMENLAHPFGEVRSSIADNLKHLSELRLHPSFNSVEDFMESCNANKPIPTLLSTPPAYDEQISLFASQLESLRASRTSSAIGTQEYDKVALTLLGWIWMAVCDHRMPPIFPFVRTLMKEFFAMQELQDNAELTTQAARAVVSLACLQYPAGIANEMMMQFIGLLKESSSWRVRLDVLYPLQIFYFHNIHLIQEEISDQLIEQLCVLLTDPKIEVREAASTTISIIVRCSHRSSILSLSKRFMKVVRETKIPKRRDTKGKEVEGYTEALTIAHSGVLGVVSLVQAFPYEVPPFIPSIFLECMSLHSASPVPISKSVRECLADFKRSHTDSWAEDQKAFTEEQLITLHDLLMGSSYYA